jgi:hypothetical protein
VKEASELERQLAEAREQEEYLSEMINRLLAASEGQSFLECTT